MDFTGKVILLTGAVGSIGKGLARRFCQLGGDVFITDLQPPASRDVCRELAALPGKCRALAADVTDHDEVRRVVAAACEAYGRRIDVLVNVAGTVGQGGPVENISPDNWDRVFAVNCKGTFLFIREVVPIMKKTGGSIVNFSSQVGQDRLRADEPLLGGQGGHHRPDAGPGLRTGRRPSASTASARESPRTRAYGTTSRRTTSRTCTCRMDEVVKKFTSKVPLGRLATVEDVVAATAFLASDDADYMTGQAINITGGREMHYRAERFSRRIISHRQNAR